MSVNNLFRPIMGTEQKILEHTYQAGNVYFATDSKKIYLDADNKNKISMGGNSSIFYGIMELTETPDEGQTEFTFTIFDIEGNEESEHLNIPNVNDLILNKDGCFYRVTALEGEGLDIIIYTEKLTIAGSGGNIEGDTNIGTFTLDRITPQNVTVLLNQNYSIGFKSVAVDSSGEETGNGTYELYVDGVKKASGVAKQGENFIPVNEYLTIGENKIRVVVSMDIGGSSMTPKSKNYLITATEMQLIWKYDELKNYHISDKDFKLEWEVTGSTEIEKVSHILIDNGRIKYDITSTENKQSKIITAEELDAYGLTHGAHKIEIYATADLNNNIVSTSRIIKNIIFVDLENSTPIINCNFFETKLIQYDTVDIPIIIYSNENINNNAVLNFFEDGVLIDTHTGVANMQLISWIYTPTVAGSKRLTITCGTTSKVLILEVESLQISRKEVEGYTLRFKASDFSSNNAVQEYWKNNNITATFSSNFDWINGGLSPIPEYDENGNRRQYFCIKAGSTMTINHNIFGTNAAVNGKCFKVIFKATKCKDYDARILACRSEENVEGKWRGLELKAQSGHFNSLVSSIDIPYCEDKYIELELDITKNEEGRTRYIQPWLDGIPSGLVAYDKSDVFTLPNQDINEYKLVIGSPDCDVYIYLIKLYDFHLTDKEHLDNFVMDASNSVEMVNRFRRNDIEDDRGEISPRKLALANPNCLVHIYDIERMSRDKNDKIKHCLYSQYHNSDEVEVSAEEVTIRVQGTSSAAYGLAAFNLDADFTQGFNYRDGTHTNGWSMREASIPVNYFCTKVNVASCEGANNALNQEWYNKFQPYQSVLRCKNKKARDTMEFTPGVLFLIDRNTEYNDEEHGGHGDNVFKDTVINDVPYKDNPYAKMYSVCNMGNSKKNISVFHDEENPLECCIENNDNQLPGQWMVVPQGAYTVGKEFYPVDLDSISEDETIECADGVIRTKRNLWLTGLDEVYSFRYPDGIKEVQAKDPEYAEKMIAGWFRLVNWMAHSNPNPKFKEYYYENEEEFLADNNRTRKWVDQDLGTFRLIAYNTIFNPRQEYFIKKQYSNKEEFNADLNEKYILNQESYIRELITSDFTFNSELDYYVKQNYADEEEYLTDYSYKYIIVSAGNRIPVTEDMLYENNKKYYVMTEHIYGYTDEKLPQPETFTIEDHTLQGYKTTLTDSEGKLWQENYTPLVQGLQISTYVGTYTHDTYEYRMAKMLKECEDYLCMDSIIFHYLFIERHSMVDNVAKNTFWSTEDCQVWNLVKDYDNDTADGINNSGKLALSYGLEPGDTYSDGVSIFNASSSVWFNFIKGLYPACEKVYNDLEAQGAWDAKTYLNDFKVWQSSIPERCWIEDFHRKYRRPYEIYGDDGATFLEMLQGGKKTHQRDQYETYQNYYISSKYFGSSCRNNHFDIRANTSSDESMSTEDMKFVVSTYADCYLKGGFGSGMDNPNYNQRVKRNTLIEMIPPVANLSDATTYLYSSNLYQTFGNEDYDLKPLYLQRASLNNGQKLRKVHIGNYEEDGIQNSSLTLLKFENNEILENLYVANLTAINGGLDLTSSPGLKELDARGSSFGSIAIADNAPLKILRINNPSTLLLSNLNELKADGFEIQNPQSLINVSINNIDNSEINSKIDILDKTIDNNGNSILESYKFTNVNWILSNKNEISYKEIIIKNQEELNNLIPVDSNDEYVSVLVKEFDEEGKFDNQKSKQKFNKLKTLGIVLYDKYKLVDMTEDIFNDYQTQGINIYARFSDENTGMVTYGKISEYQSNITRYYLEEYNIVNEYQNGIITYYKKSDNGINIFTFNSEIEDYELIKSKEYQNVQYFEMVVNVLDRLSNLSPIAENNITIPRENSLTGNITITSDAYNGNQALDIYNKYIHKNLYPNVNLIFESENAQLYDVTIKNGNGDIVWTRKISSGEKIDKLFLSNGPQGAFTLDKIYKDPTVSTEYTFNKKWQIEGISDLEFSTEDGYPYYQEQITSNIILIPQFDASPIMYTVEFYDADDNLLVSGRYEYGTAYANIIPNTIPAKDATELEEIYGIKAGYNFIGYSLIKDSHNVNELPEIVAIDATYYAVFEEVSDITTIVHPEWFDYEECVYERERNEDGTPTELGQFIPDSEIKLCNSGYQKGYKAILKTGLQGKITIPAKYNNQNIIAVDINRDAYNVSHIFFEQESHVLEILDSANTMIPTDWYPDEKYPPRDQLKYFDFNQESIRYINGFVFCKCPQLRLPQNENDLIIKSKLIFVGTYAFARSCKTDKTNITIKIPSSIREVEQGGFSFLEFMPNGGNTIQIGSAEEKSQLNLNLPDLSLKSSEDANNTIQKFYFNPNGYVNKIIFYTENYFTPDTYVVPNISDEDREIIGGYAKIQVEHAFPPDVTSYSFNDISFPEEVEE